MPGRTPTALRDHPECGWLRWIIRGPHDDYRFGSSLYFMLRSLVRSRSVGYSATPGLTPQPLFSIGESR